MGWIKLNWLSLWCLVTGINYLSPLHGGPSLSKRFKQWFIGRICGEWRDFSGDIFVLVHIPWFVNVRFSDFTSTKYLYLICLITLQQSFLMNSDGMGIPDMNVSFLKLKWKHVPGNFHYIRFMKNNKMAGFVKSTISSISAQRLCLPNYHAVIPLVFDP